MKILEAKKCFFDYHRINSKANTIRNYELLLPRFCDQFGDRELESISSEEVLSFLTRFTEGTKQSTKRLRYSLLSAFFNFIRNSTDPQLQNPCDTLSLESYARIPNPIIGRF
jgi:integrase/recombinase XerD